MLRIERPSAFQGAVEHLLFSAPNLVALNRLAGEFAAVGVPADNSPLGLRVSCAAADWRLLLEVAALALSPRERAATHVAVLMQSEDPMALHQAIFQAPALQQLLEQIRESWLYDVLERSAISIHLQPLVQYPPGRIHGYECLMRGTSDDGRLISPARMLRAARKLGILDVLDEQSRLAALRHSAAIAAPDTRFFINFLPSAIEDPERCLQATLAAASAAGLLPGQIVFEVVETENLTDRRQLMEILRYYRQQGFLIALDDVGAGYASLLSLSELRPDYIKLDGELVRRAARSALEAKIVQDLAETARQNGIITIAEGIETEQHLQFALASGIRITQGYFHCVPNPAPLSGEEACRIVERISQLMSAAAFGGA